MEYGKGSPDVVIQCQFCRIYMWKGMKLKKMVHLITVFPVQMVSALHSVNSVTNIIVITTITY